MQVSVDEKICISRVESRRQTEFEFEPNSKWVGVEWKRLLQSLEHIHRWGCRRRRRRRLRQRVEVVPWPFENVGGTNGNDDSVFGAAIFAG